jgi:excisionase family DNA binding protein
MDIYGKIMYNGEKISAITHMTKVDNWYIMKVKNYLTMEKIYTLQETADFLKVSKRSVIRYIKSGRLKATKIGQWRISESAITDFLNPYKNPHDKSNKKQS